VLQPVQSWSGSSARDRSVRESWWPRIPLLRRREDCYPARVVAGLIRDEQPDLAAFKAVNSNGALPSRLDAKSGNIPDLRATEENS